MLRLTIDGIAAVDGTTIHDGTALEQLPATIISDGPVAIGIEAEPERAPTTVGELADDLETVCEHAQGDGMTEAQVAEAVMRVARETVDQ